MNAITRLDLEKLGKVCGLFGSDHAGERAEAARRADLILKRAGVTWPELLGQQPGAGAYFEPPARREEPLSAGEILAHHGYKLTSWERGFLGSMIRQHGRMSLKQRQVMAGIREKVAGCGR